MASAITQRSILRHLENFKHHIYAAYSDQNAPEVGLVLEHLRQNGLKVYDPAAERVPGKRIFYKWLENGIHKSRITLLFWSKEFKQDELCLYQSENAILRTSLTKGRHIVICVVINNCKIPNLYKQFDCVYAWKWRENPPEALDNVLQAIIAHLQKSKKTYNLGNRASFLVRKRAGALPCQHNAKKSRNYIFKAMNVLLNFRKIQTILENCVLCCQNHGCAFRCSGDNIKQFYAHLSACKFAHIQCMNIRCRQTILRGQSVKHKKRCRYKKIKCPNDNCTEELTPNELKQHKATCPHGTKNCPNHNLGCREVFELKDKEEHLKSCLYVMEECDLCKTRIIRMGLEEHKQNKCPHGPATCPHCNSKVKRIKLESHTKKCSIQVTCENIGCGAKMVQGLLQKHKLNCPWETFKCSHPGCPHTATKGSLKKHVEVCDYRQQHCIACGRGVAMKDMNWHRKFCDQMLECTKCGQTIPASTKSSHDKWMCSKGNLRSFCRDCRTVYSQGRQKEHVNDCKPVCVPEVVRPTSGAKAVSKPIGIVRPTKNYENERFPSAPSEHGFNSHNYSSLNQPDSGFDSLSTSFGRSSTPLTRLEMGALKEAIEETIEDTNTSSPKPATPNLSSWTQITSTGTPVSGDNWRQGYKKITPKSRQTLKVIDDLFYGYRQDSKQNKFSPDRRKELTSRTYYRR